MAQLLLLNKPYQVLSQFTTSKDGDSTRRNLSDVIPAAKFPGFYPAGRLDYDSEGLLLLTDDGGLQHRIAHPKHKLEKVYWVQVEGEVTSTAISALREGVELKDGRTQAAKVKVIERPSLWARHPPIRKRDNIPSAWLEIRIREGKNRQVRRMTAAVQLPALRLIRVAIGPWTLDGLVPGEYKVGSVHLPPTANTRASKPRKGQKPRRTTAPRS